MISNWKMIFMVRTKNISVLYWANLYTRVRVRVRGLDSHKQLIKYYECLLFQQGGGPRIVVSTAAFHARARGSVPGLGGLKETKMCFFPIHV